jgi:hypothetical protein
MLGGLPVDGHTNRNHEEEHAGVCSINEINNIHLKRTIMESIVLAGRYIGPDWP